MRFGGERVDISTQEKFDEVVQYLGGIKEDSAWSESLNFNIFTIHTDDKEFNVWRNYITGELPKFTLPWAYAEPNGGMIENCAQVWELRKKKDGKWTASVNDCTCGNLLPVVCEGVGTVRLTLRG